MIPTNPTLKSAQSNSASGSVSAVPAIFREAQKSDLPVRVPTPELTPKAQAKASNKLPRAEQMSNFEEHLEEKDSGNRPA